MALIKSLQKKVHQKSSDVLNYIVQSNNEIDEMDFCMESAIYGDMSLDLDYLDLDPDELDDEDLYDEGEDDDFEEDDIEPSVSLDAMLSTINDFEDDENDLDVNLDTIEKELRSGALDYDPDDDDDEFDDIYDDVDFSDIEV